MSPIITYFDSAIVLNQPSMDKFAEKVKPGGLILSIIQYHSSNTRTNIEIFGIPAATEAVKMKNPKIINMIMLGAYLERKPVVKIESVIEALKKVLPRRIS